MFPGVKIVGNTYPVRVALEHQFKATWDKSEKCWRVPEEFAEAAQALVNQQPAEASLLGMLPLYGNTFPIKEQLRGLGGRWDAAEKVWKLPPEKLAAAQKILAEMPQEETKQCWECGGTFTYAECKRNGGDWNDDYCGC